jgi:hypothetical protein
MADLATPPTGSGASQNTTPAAMARLAEMEDYFAALKTVRFARVIFIVLVTVSLLLQVALYLTIRFWNVQTLENLLMGQAAGEHSEAMTFWQFALDFGLPLAHFVGALAAFLLLIACLLSVNVSLCGRLGGAQPSISSFFWAVLLLAMLVPWQKIVPVTEVPSVFYTLADLQDVARYTPELMLDNIVHYVRYLAYPVLALLVLLACGLGARRGFRQAAEQLQPAGIRFSA